MDAERLGLGEPLWVLGTLAQSSIPFGAFGPLRFSAATRPSRSWMPAPKARSIASPSRLS
jgi:hypothetical protein